MKVLPEPRLYRERAWACLSGFSGSFSFFGLFGSFGSNSEINQTNKIDQTGEINEIDQLRLHASLTDIPEQRAGERVRRAPSPLVAPLPRRSERKPSGIPSVTVVPTVMLRSVPAFLLRTPGGAPPLRRMSRAALAHLNGVNNLGLLRSWSRRPRVSLQRGVIYR